MMIYSLAADISKDKFDTCLLAYSLTEQTSHVIARKEFNNSSSGFSACIQWVCAHLPDPSASLRVTMEATGVYYEPLALFIDRNHPDIHLAVVLPSKAKKYITSRGLRSKTDKIDAYGLSLLGAERKLAAGMVLNRFGGSCEQ